MSSHPSLRFRGRTVAIGLVVGALVAGAAPQAAAAAGGVAPPPSTPAPTLARTPPAAVAPSRPPSTFAGALSTIRATFSASAGFGAGRMAKRAAVWGLPSDTALRGRRAGAPLERAASTTPAEIEVHQTTPLLTVRTHDLHGAPEMPMSLRDAEAVDRAIGRVVGADLWTRAKSAGVKLDDHIDRTANRLGLPPEGIHPAYAESAKPLVQRALGKDGGRLTTAELTRADAELAGQIRSAPSEAIPVIDDFLRHARVDARLAPETTRALGERTLPLSAAGREAVRLAGAPTTGASSDEALATAVEHAAPSDLLPLTRAFERAGLITRESGFYTWKPTARGASMRATLRALGERDYREEALFGALANDPTFDALSREHDALVGSIEQRIGRNDGVRGALLAGQRLGQKFVDRRGLLAAADAPKDLAHRDAVQVFRDHLDRRRAGHLDLDLERNYAEDVMLTSNHGTFFGRDGIKQSAAVLAELVPTRKWVMDRLYFDGDVVFETWSAQTNGKLVRGFDAFVIKNGKIVTQTVYYGPGSLTE